VTGKIQNPIQNPKILLASPSPHPRPCQRPQSAGRLAGSIASCSAKKCLRHGVTYGIASRAGRRVPLVPIARSRSICRRLEAVVRAGAEARAATPSLCISGEATTKLKLRCSGPAFDRFAAPARPLQGLASSTVGQRWCSTTIKPADVERCLRTFQPRLRASLSPRRAGTLGCSPTRTRFNDRETNISKWDGRLGPGTRNAVCAWDRRGTTQKQLPPPSDCSRTTAHDLAAAGRLERGRLDGPAEASAGVSRLVLPARACWPWRWQGRGTRGGGVTAKALKTAMRPRSLPSPKRNASPQSTSRSGPGRPAINTLLFCGLIETATGRVAARRRASFPAAAT